MAKTQLLAVTTIALLGIAGCARRSATDENLTHSLQTSNVQSAPHEHAIPSGWPETSAANPTGWADQSERRQQEIDFAAGAEVPITPRSAVGGGPANFED